MVFNYEGHPVPQVTFQVCGGVGCYPLSTADLFEKKTIVLFAIPGAFTSPYSPIQLLGYNEYASAFRANGVDEIVCLSVNDPYSLATWSRQERASRIRFIPDVNGDFTREMGMMVDLSEQGMGQRSRRYSMLVKNRVIQKIFVEKKSLETMPIVSNAETMLHYLNPRAQKPEQTVVLMQMWRSLLSA